MKPVLLAIAVLLLMQNSMAQNAPAGVLIGLQRPGADMPSASEPIAAGSLRTLWIPLTPSSQSARLETIELSDLLIPRRSGFWQAGLLGTCAEQQDTDINDKPIGFMADVADYFWAAPVGTRPQVQLDTAEEKVGPCKEKEVRCINDERREIYWVWPEYISMNASSRYECGVHPDAVPGFGVRSLSFPEKELSVAGILGPAAEATLKRAYDKALIEFRKDSAQCDLAPFDPSSWYIQREEGRWKTIGSQEAPRVCNYGFDYQANLDLSAIAGRRNDDPARWQQLKARIPKLEDAHASPVGPWVVAATQTQLLIFANAQSTTPLLTVPLKEYERMIMMEWASGTSVARWTDEVRRVRAANRPQPTIKRPAA